MNYGEAADLIRQWADLSDPIQGATVRFTPDWQAVERMIEAARDLLTIDCEILKYLLTQSDQSLHPLEDPLRTDFGVHRWLASQREEVYSDWLAWVLQQVEKPELVFSLFRISPPKDISDWSGLPPVIEREVPVPAGHEDQSGKLDVVVRYPGRALFMVEVKLTRTADADLGALPGYLSWMDERQETVKIPILLVTDSEDEQVGKFRVRRWRDFSLELRRLVSTLRENRGIVAAAMTLAFVGAVEQNLVGLPAEPLKGLESGRILNVAETLEYLDLFLKEKR
jgi:hypothetical protein